MIEPLSGQGPGSALPDRSPKLLRRPAGRRPGPGGKPGDSASRGPGPDLQAQRRADRRRPRPLRDLRDPTGQPLPGMLPRRRHGDPAAQASGSARRPRPPDLQACSSSRDPVLMLLPVRVSSAWPSAVADPGLRPEAALRGSWVSVTLSVAGLRPDGILLAVDPGDHAIDPGELREGRPPARSQSQSPADPDPTPWSESTTSSA